jgi:hypothetical protein
LIEIGFIILYALEQLWLIININADNSSIIVSIYVVISLSTFALQKIAMESRIKYLDTDLHFVIEEYNQTILKFRNLKVDYDALSDESGDLQKSLVKTEKELELLKTQVLNKKRTN